MESETDGGILRVDLGTSTVSTESIPDQWRRQFVGGKGLAARILYSELDGSGDPLGPENVLIFAGGPLTGLLPGEDRYVVCTKSPQTQGFLDSYSGGSVPGHLVGALEDHEALLVTGQSPEPSRIVVADGTARIESAADWWGLDTHEIAEKLAAPAGAYIGPAGEAQVRYATIASDGGEHHASRGGAGAVMGAKRLKAISFKGDPPHIPPEIESLREELQDRFESSTTGQWHQAGGTIESVDFADAVGGLATRGWQSGRFGGTDDIGIDAVADRSTGRERDDGAMPGDYRVPDEQREDGEQIIRGGAGMTLGAGLGIDEAEAVAELTSTCDRLGLDLVSAGNAIAWAIRASETGVIDSPVTFGDAAAIQELLVSIASRTTSVADVLADGVAAAVDTYGGEALIPAIKGLELPNYHPRAAPSMALAYATSDRGACHRRARPIERESLDTEWSPARAAEEVIAEQDSRAAHWCLIADDFIAEVLPEYGREWLAAIGHPAAETNLTKLGERVWTLTRLFNVRAGWDRSDDELPAAIRSTDERDPTGVTTGHFEAMLDAYYRKREWDRDGRPTQELIKRLELSGLIEDPSELTERVDPPSRTDG